MKLATVECMFPELKGKNIYKTGRGEGSNAKAAISRAFGDAFKQIRGKRFRSIKATITVIEKANPEEALEEKAGVNTPQQDQE